MSEEIINEILNNPQIISLLSDKIYSRLKEEIVIKNLKDLNENIKSLQETVKQQGEAIASLQKTVDKHTEAIAELQEIVKQHTEAIKSLQETVKQQGEAIASLQKTVDKHTEAIAELQNAVKSLQKAVNRNSKAILKLGREIKLLSVEVGSFTNRAGKGLERTMLKLYKKALELHGVDPSKVIHGQIIDDLGIISKGRIYEVDFYEIDGYVYVFEIKNYADKDTIEQIDIRKKLFSAKYKDKKIKIFLVANFVEKEVKEQLEKDGIEVIYSHIID